jgi:hypothetical protein
LQALILPEKGILAAGAVMTAISPSQALTTISRAYFKGGIGNRQGLL